MTNSDQKPSAQTVLFSANAFATFHLCQVLIEKGILTKPEAASTMTRAAESLRQMSEDGASAQFGETIAQKIENLAEWLLGLVPKT